MEFINFFVYAYLTAGVIYAMFMISQGYYKFLDIVMFVLAGPPTVLYILYKTLKGEKMPF